MPWISTGPVPNETPRIKPTRVVPKPTLVVHQTHSRGPPAHRQTHSCGTIFKLKNSYCVNLHLLLNMLAERPSSRHNARKRPSRPPCHHVSPYHAVTICLHTYTSHTPRTSGARCAHLSSQPIAGSTFYSKLTEATLHIVLGYIPGRRLPRPYGTCLNYTHQVPHPGYTRVYRRWITAEVTCLAIVGVSGSSQITPCSCYRFVLL